MQHLFLNYELSKVMKEKGFDEKGFAKYIKNSFQLNTLGDGTDYNSGKYGVNLISAPLYQQALDWLETKGFFIELIADGWTYEGDNEKVTKLPCYRAFVWQVGKDKPKPHHDLGCSSRYRILDIAIKHCLELL